MSLSPHDDSPHLNQYYSRDVHLSKITIFHMVKLCQTNNLTPIITQNARTWLCERKCTMLHWKIASFRKLWMPQVFSENRWNQIRPKNISLPLTLVHTRETLKWLNLNGTHFLSVNFCVNVGCETNCHSIWFEIVPPCLKGKNEIFPHLLRRLIAHCFEWELSMGSSGLPQQPFRLEFESEFKFANQISSSVSVWLGLTESFHFLE